jgi:hypothetical protein
VVLSLTSFDPLTSESAVPFNILLDSDPLTRVVAASFVTDSGRQLKKVALLLQKDRYDLERDELWPLTNRDIDDAWQRAFSLYADWGDADSRILLSGQTGSDGVPKPFSSLFYCKRRGTFFHPPCPLCGRPLRLCTEDDLLLASGLRPYSSSTKRHMYCDSCGANVFYVHVRTYDDPETVKDLRSLIDSFGLMRGNSIPACDFPCLGCPDHDSCYGETRAAQTRIVPFSFYPFHLRIFDSLSLPALDFLPLISGATFDEVKNALTARNESGRANCLVGLQRDGLLGSPLFPAHDERFFLEVLYLKLAFLGDVLRQTFLQPETTGQPEMRLTIDRIWVDLSGQSRLLPSYWNFRARILDIVRPSDLSQCFPKPVSPNLLHAGLLWLSTLLVNNSQSSRDLMLSLKELLSKADSLPGIPAEQISQPVFLPEQIFWKPEGKQVNRVWMSLWEKTIGMGFELTQSGIHSDRQWSSQNFMAEFERLQAQVKCALFESPPLAMERPAQTDQVSENADIHKALTGIIEKWRGDGKHGSLPKNPAEGMEMTETIVLSSAEIVSQVFPVRDEEEWTETVVISARNVPVEPPPHFPKDRRDDVLLETVVLSPGGAWSGQMKTAQMDAGQEAVPETVILSPSARPTESLGLKSTVEFVPAGEREEVAAGEDDLPETVILSSQTPKFRSKSWKD